MANVEIEINIEEAVMEAIQVRIEAALEVANDVPQLLKDKASLDNEDVDGNQMPPKQPRPKRNPKNFPNLPLVQTANMFDHDRWKVERTDETTATVVYSPPDYFWHLIEKPPEAGGRKWLTADRINPDVAADVQARMVTALEGDTE